MGIATARGTSVQVAAMPQLAEARDDEDDWTGLADAAARRKIQTRLSTRAYRRRKALRAAGKPAPEIEAPPVSNGVPCWDEQRQIVTVLPASVAETLTRHERPLITRKPSPPNIIFPLSSDHLIVLIQMNVLRAIIVNSQLISELVPTVLAHDCTHGAVRVVPPSSGPGQVPDNLVPTHIQSYVPHDHWIDIFPHPTWRDNFIRAAGTFNPQELCSDLIGGLFEGGAPAECETRGIVVWSPSWDFNGWELSEGFVRKWGWSIDGCLGVLEATNRWRSSRGEKALVLEI